MIEILGNRTGCKPCTDAKARCREYGVVFEFIDIKADEDGMARLVDMGLRSVPQIFVDGKHIGGYEALIQHLHINS